VKLRQFNDLCDREWAKPKRGDVVSMRLTAASHHELVGDMAMNPDRVITPLLWDIDKADLPAIREGRAAMPVVNPITRTQVRITIRAGGKRDTARVCIMGGTYRQTWWPACG
jgi:hypothetical protein